MNERNTWPHGQLEARPQRLKDPDGRGGQSVLHVDKVNMSGTFDPVGAWLVVHSQRPGRQQNEWICRSSGPVEPGSRGLKKPYR